MFLQVIRQTEARAASRPQGGRGQNRARILDAASRLLRMRSLDALSMDEIARAAGLTRRTIYNHFASTDEIFAVSRKALFAEIAPLVPVSIVDTASPRMALTRFAYQAQRLFDDIRHADLHLAVAREGHARPWIAHYYEARIQSPMIAALATCLAEARHNGEFAGDPHTAAFQLLWTIQAVTASRVFACDAPPVGDATCIAIEGIVNAFLVQHAAETAIAA